MTLTYEDLLPPGYNPAFGASNPGSLNTFPIKINPETGRYEYFTPGQYSFGSVYPERTSALSGYARGMTKSPVFDEGSQTWVWPNESTGWGDVWGPNPYRDLADPTAREGMVPYWAENPYTVSNMYPVGSVDTRMPGWTQAYTTGGLTGFPTLTHLYEQPEKTYGGEYYTGSPEQLQAILKWGGVRSPFGDTGAAWGAGTPVGSWRRALGLPISAAGPYAGWGYTDYGELNTSDIQKNILAEIPLLKPEEAAAYQTPEKMLEIGQRALSQIPLGYIVPEQNQVDTKTYPYGTQYPQADIGLQNYPYTPARQFVPWPTEGMSPAWGYSGTPGLHAYNVLEPIRQQVNDLSKLAASWQAGGSNVAGARRTIAEQKAYEKALTDAMNWTYPEQAMGTDELYNQRLAEEAWAKWKPAFMQMFLPSTIEGGGLPQTGQSPWMTLAPAPLRAPSLAGTASTPSWSFAPRWA